MVTRSAGRHYYDFNLKFVTVVLARPATVTDCNPSAVLFSPTSSQNKCGGTDEVGVQINRSPRLDGRLE